MKSPFPGMDPYLETDWRDVHTSLMTYIRDQIQDQLPDDLVARIEGSVAVDYEDNSRRIAPDVRVVENYEDAALGYQTASVAVAEPLLVLEVANQIARHVQILEVSSGDRVVTAIEVLSPTNKRTNGGREDYRITQQDYFDASVNLVEIDLLRGGEYVLAAALKKIPRSKRRLYMMSVQTRMTTKLFGATLREPLPTIPIPLRPKDRDVALNIQQLIDLVYERGRYAKLSYQLDPDLPFSAEDATWVDELLRQQGRRK